MKRRYVLWSLMACLLGLPSQSWSQATSFQVEQFEPLHAVGINVLNLATSQVLPAGAPSFGLHLHYADDEFQLVRGADESSIVTRIVDHQFKLELSAGFGIAGFADIGVILPLTLSQSGVQLANVLPQPSESLDSFALGDLRLVPRIRLVNHEGDGVGVSLLGTIYIPTGDEDSYNSEGRIRVEPRLAVDYAAPSGFVVGINLGYQLRGKNVSVNHESDDALKYGLFTSIPMDDDDELALVGSLFGAVGTSADSDDPRDTPVEIQVGPRWYFADDWVVNASGGFGLTDGVGAPDFRFTAAVGYTPRGNLNDVDGDGIIGDADRCPDDPEDHDRFQDTDGCPDPDNDGDGVLDVLDGTRDDTGYGSCRDNPEDKDGFEDPDGCPDPDNDNDGVPDVTDGAVDDSGFGACRDNPEDMDGFQDADGCPDEDNDGDGVPDVADGADDGSGFGNCRDNPEDKDGFEDADGCPDPDNDKDGVPDVDDGPTFDSRYPGFGLCRNAPGPSVAELNAKGKKAPWSWKGDDKTWPGCPLIIADCNCGQIIITQKIKFKYGGAKLTQAGRMLLDQVAAVFIDKQCATSIRIEGHTDWHGSTAYNEKLSQARVNSVKWYLARKGVDIGRLVAKGYGESRPIDPTDPGKTCERCTPGCTCEVGSKKYPELSEAEIRAENRRVQFRILELNGQSSEKVQKCVVDY